MFIYSLLLFIIIIIIIIIIIRWYVLCTYHLLYLYESLFFSFMFISREICRQIISKIPMTIIFKFSQYPCHD